MMDLLNIKITMEGVSMNTIKFKKVDNLMNTNITVFKFGYQYQINSFKEMYMRQEIIPINKTLKIKLQEEIVSVVIKNNIVLGLEQYTSPLKEILVMFLEVGDSELEYENILKENGMELISIKNNEVKNEPNNK